jgi:hypothetical protein
MRALLIALLLSSGAIAEPSPEVKYLMNEPMTMWDWGIYRLENVLEDNLDGLEARYPWITSQHSLQLG